MFKESPEGQTHSYNDGCGEPAHNTMIEPLEQKLPMTFNELKVNNKLNEVIRALNELKWESMTMEEKQRKANQSEKKEEKVVFYDEDTSYRRGFQNGMEQCRESHQPSEPKSTETMYSVGRLCGLELWIDGTAEMAKSVMERLRKLLDAQPSEPKGEWMCSRKVHIEAPCSQCVWVEQKEKCICDTIYCPKHGAIGYYVPPKGSTEDRNDVN